MRGLKTIAVNVQWGECSEMILIVSFHVTGIYYDTVSPVPNPTISPWTLVATSQVSSNWIDPFVTRKLVERKNLKLLLSDSIRTACSHFYEIGAVGTNMGKLLTSPMVKIYFNMFSQVYFKIQFVSETPVEI